jgi:hypothetical protein
MMSVNAFLLLPIRPRRKTISGTKSRLLQIPYAYRVFWISRNDNGGRAYPFKIVVTTRSQIFNQPRRRVFGKKGHLKIRKVRCQLLIFLKQSVEIVEQVHWSRV